MSASTQPIIIKKKKVDGHGGHHGGSWKVAYADFVTAMMAFFMVMWIMGLSTATRKSIQSYFNDPVGFMQNEPRTKEIMEMNSGSAGKPKGTEKGRGAANAEQKVMEGVQRQVEKQVAGDKGIGDLGKNVKVAITDAGLQIEFVEAQGAVFFESGSSTIRPAARAIVAHLAPILAKSGKPMIVEGHTDAAPCGGPGGNLGLSASRATALAEALQSDGIPESRFRGATGYGSTRLERPDKPYDFSNRRVTILLPREAKDGQEAPASELRDRLKGGNSPEALDLRPGPVEVKGDR